VTMKGEGKFGWLLRSEGVRGHFSCTCQTSSFLQQFSKQIAFSYY
jgi:hypothetical protein